MNKLIPVNKKSLFKRGYECIEKKEEVPIYLDEQQMEAVYSRNSLSLVVAGAGSGKTRVITERVKFLLDEGVPPSNIIAITFTNMAAEEMKERLSDVDGIGDVFIGTIHSFANKVMKLSGDRYFLYNDQIDNEYHRELITRYCKFLTYEKYLAYKDALMLVDMGKEKQSSLEGFLSPSEQSELDILNRSVESVEIEKKNAGDKEIEYPDSIHTLCRKRGVITFDELLGKATKYFKSINADIEHVLVDELQDVGMLEFNFIESLQADNYFLVGDDWQSIYSFKGGNVNIFLKLIEDRIFKVFYLTNNYRNSTQVIEMSHKVISQVSRRIDKVVVQMYNNDGCVQIMSRSKLNDIFGIICRSSNYCDWFILVRTNKELHNVAEKCSEYGIPFTTFKREGMSLNELRRRMDSNKVKILTVHVSKGLEVKNVVLYGNFPIMCPSYRRDDEERKVMYVGVTRAIDNLYILN